MLVILADAKPEDKTFVHSDVDSTLHCASLPHTKTILNLLTVLCWFMLAPDAVFTGSNADFTITPAPTIGVPPTPSKRSIMSWTEVHGKAFTVFIDHLCMYVLYVGVLVVPAGAKPENEPVCITILT